MKKNIILILFFSLALFSCSSSSDDDTSDNSKYAMTAKINGIAFEANNPFGTNELSNTTIWNYFPSDDYILLQGRQGGVFGNPEINIWLKKIDIVVGNYIIGEETFDTPPSHHIGIIDSSNQISENTKAGNIEITEVNTSTKIVKGTFQFTTVDDLNDPSAPIDLNITDGTFRYTYE